MIYIIYIYTKKIYICIYMYYPDFLKKGLVCVHLWLELSFKMQFSEYLEEKMAKVLLTFESF